ncbi:MAG: protoporphyrinogen oxidase [Polyangiaceae bacterium]
MSAPIRPLRIAVVGGGITGLSAAYEAMRRARDLGRAVKVTVLERSARFGGILTTERASGFLLDGGPDSWVRTKPHATALARELGLGSQIIGENPANRRYFVAYQGRLHAVPDGMVLGAPTKLAPLARSRLFSLRGKLRMAAEVFVPPRAYGADGDESIAHFAERRLGREAAERLVAPLLGGISGGDASDLSVHAAFPQLVAMEREHGSLIRGMRAARRAREAAGTEGESTFLSLEGGIEELPKALVARLTEGGVDLRASAYVRGMARNGAAGWTLRIDGGESLEADAVLLAIPAGAAARLLGEVDPEGAAALGELRQGSTSTVFLGYRSADVLHPLGGVGFVVPPAEGRSILACTWVSSKWRGRAPAGHVLVRAFLGGSMAGSDEEAIDLARGDLRALMGLGAEPVLSRVFRFEQASARMLVGHLGAMRRLKERLAVRVPGVRVAGGGYEGIGIPDCVRQGREAGGGMVEG